MRDPDPLNVWPIYTYPDIASALSFLQDYLGIDITQKDDKFYYGEFEIGKLKHQTIFADWYGKKARVRVMTNPNHIIIVQKIDGITSFIEEFCYWYYTVDSTYLTVYYYWIGNKQYPVKNILRYEGGGLENVSRETL